ncbi:MAG: hypothetical protein ACREP8_15805, partial [Candidatus Binatia bacterium]
MISLSFPFSSFRFHRFSSSSILSPVSFILVALIFSGCSTKTVPDPQYVPARDLLDVVKDFQRFAREDLYRFPIPKDVTGMNIMKATLIRLEDYEKKNPGQWTDIVQFSKATAYERLRDYDQATGCYRKVAAMDGRLGAE